MSRKSYRSVLRLLENWPTDTTKTGGRDIGEHIRIRISEAFHQGENTPVNEIECQRIYSSLNRIATNTYFTQYPRTRSSTSTGLTGEICRQIISTEGLAAMKIKEPPTLTKEQK